MAISAFDLFKIGIGPSSSHTVGPMLAAAMFAGSLRGAGALRDVVRVKAEMYGSLGATGRGHGTPKAVMLGLEGERPQSVDVDEIPVRIEAIRKEKRLRLNGDRAIAFHEKEDLLLYRRKALPQHPNGMRFTAYRSREGTGDRDTGADRRPGRNADTGRDNADRSADSGDSNELLSRTYYSVGGGFVLDESGASVGSIVEDERRLAWPFTTAAQLLAHCDASGLGISGVMLANEKAWRSEAETRYGLLRIWDAMQECVDRGCRNEGVLPGRAENPEARAPPSQAVAGQARGVAVGPAHGARLGHALRAGRQRGERRGRARGDGAHQRRGGHRPGGAALLRPFRPRRERRRRGPLPADRRRHRRALQGERLHQRRRGGLPGRGRLGLLHGRGRAGRSARRDARGRWRTPPRSPWNTTSG